MLLEQFKTVILGYTDFQYGSEEYESMFLYVQCVPGVK